MVQNNLLALFICLPYLQFQNFTSFIRIFHKLRFNPYWQIITEELILEHQQLKGKFVRVFRTHLSPFVEDAKYSTVVQHTHQNEAARL